MNWVLFVFMAALGLSAAEPKKVFAHYMVCIPTYGGGSSIADYQKEIRAAQAVGVDGFALNCGSWTKEGYYKQRALLIYQAAKELGTGFELLLSIDHASGISDAEVKDMIETVRDHPNQFRYKGKPVVSTFAGDASKTKFLRDTFGDSVVYVPFYYPKPAAEMPGEGQVGQVFDEHAAGVDGFFHFGAAGTSGQVVKTNRRMAQKWKGAGKLFMVGISPFYRGHGINYRVFNYNGFEGVAQQWEGAIEDGADWVELVTWNDWGESSYFAPLPDNAPAGSIWTGQWGVLTSHKAYLDASCYYIAWFKTGKKPSIQKDRLFYFYRLNPANVPANKNLSDAGKNEMGLPDHAQKLPDGVYVSVFLKAPAECSIYSGAAVQTFALPEGASHVSMGFCCGPQRFVLKRGSKIIIDKTGEFEVSLDKHWSVFNMFSGEALSVEVN